MKEGEPQTMKMGGNLVQVERDQSSLVAEFFPFTVKTVATELYTEKRETQ